MKNLEELLKWAGWERVREETYGLWRRNRTIWRDPVTGVEHETRMALLIQSGREVTSDSLDRSRK